MDGVGVMHNYDREATMEEADLEYAYAIGRHRPGRAWILSDRDVWYPNPFYHGPATRHPEDWDEADADWYA